MFQSSHLVFFLLFWVNTLYIWKIIFIGQHLNDIYNIGHSYNISFILSPSRKVPITAAMSPLCIVVPSLCCKYDRDRGSFVFIEIIFPPREERSESFVQLTIDILRFSFAPSLQLPCMNFSWRSVNCQHLAVSVQVASQINELPFDQKELTTYHRHFFHFCGHV